MGGVSGGVDGIVFVVGVKVVVFGGIVKIIGDCVIVEDVNVVMIYFFVWMSF